MLIFRGSLLESLNYCCRHIRMLVYLIIFFNSILFVVLKIVHLKLSRYFTGTIFTMNSETV